MKLSIKDWRFRLVLLIGFLGGLYLWINHLYLEKAFFDETKRITIQSDQIEQIEILDGRWNWPDAEWKMNPSTILKFSDRDDIIKTCSIINDARAKYVDDIQGVYGFLTVKLRRRQGSAIILRLNQNLQKDIFFEYDDHTFEGSALSTQVKQLGDKYGIKSGSE